MKPFFSFLTVAMVLVFLVQCKKDKNDVPDVQRFPAPFAIFHL